MMPIVCRGIVYQYCGKRVHWYAQNTWYSTITLNYLINKNIQDFEYFQIMIGTYQK